MDVVFCDFRGHRSHLFIRKQLSFCTVLQIFYRVGHIAKRCIVEDDQVFACRKRKRLVCGIRQQTGNGNCGGGYLGAHGFSGVRSTAVFHTVFRRADLIDYIITDIFDGNPAGVQCSISGYGGEDVTEGRTGFVPAFEPITGAGGMFGFGCILLEKHALCKVSGSVIWAEGHRIGRFYPFCM